MLRAVAMAGFVFCTALGARATFAEVDVKTPWANVYVGPGGIFVHGPWGRVEVPTSDRDRVCRAWRESTREHYETRDCKIEFDDDGCTIKEVVCDK